MPASRLISSVSAAAMAIGLSAVAAPAEAEGHRVPLVVELFTSQGCSSCPPANANLIRLRDREDILALSFAVTYWDRLGWKDVFGRPEFTDRQERYEPALGHDGPFTPQLVVNGQRDVVGNDLSEIEGLLAGRKLGQGPAVALAGDHVSVGAGDAPAKGADIWLVTYDPRVVSVEVRRGENGGRSLPHTHVVRRLQRLGTWNGAPIDRPFAPAEAGLKTAVLVQTSNGGPILAAATD